VKVSGFVDVRDLGARGDGWSDDTDAVQAAIDAGGVIYFPPGDYSCRTLTMRAATRLSGANSGSYGYRSGAYVSPYPTGSVSRVIRRAGTNGPLVMGPVGAGHVILEDLELDGSNPSQTAGDSHVVCVADSEVPDDSQWFISRCYVHGRKDPRGSHWGSGASNIYIGAGRMACHITGTVSNFANHHGIQVNGADAVVDGCIVGDNGAHGVVVGAWATTITSCAIYNNTNGIHITDTGPASPKRIIVSSNGIDRNRVNGILVDGGQGSGAAGVTITGNGFTSNGTDGDGQAAHISVHSRTGHLALGGNVFSDLEPGYSHRTSAAIHLEPGATAVDMGNVYEGGSVRGFTNAPRSLYRSTPPA